MDKNADISFYFYKNMKFSKLFSIVIFVSSIATILLFALIFWLYSNADTNTLVLLKESLSITSSFFGGITTLIAAYIATTLFNDWKVQHNKIVEKEVAWDAIHKFDIADLHLTQFKESYFSFRLKYNNLYAITDEEFENFGNELQTILLGLNGSTIKFSALLESLRKYSIVAKNDYYEVNKQFIADINSKVFHLQNLKATCPISFDDIETTLEEIIAIVIHIEDNTLNIILKELKASS